MKRYNALRSARVNAMLDMLNTIDYGAPELEYLTGQDDNYQLKDELNTYRAQLIARYFGVNVSKTKLLRFSKPKDHRYVWTSQQLMNYIDDNHDAFVNYWEWFRQPAINKVLDEYDKKLTQSTNKSSLNNK